MKSKNLTKNKKLYKPSKRILSGEEPLKLKALQKRLLIQLI